MSRLRMLGLVASSSRRVESSTKLWLRITLGSPKFDPTTPQNLK